MQAIHEYSREAKAIFDNTWAASTQDARVPLLGLIAGLAARMAALLDARSGFRLPIVLAGALLASGRRTASRWFEAAGVTEDDLLSLAV